MVCAIPAASNRRHQGIKERLSHGPLFFYAPILPCAGFSKLRAWGSASRIEIKPLTVHNISGSIETNKSHLRYCMDT
jgi:hypothetical protein